MNLKEIHQKMGELVMFLKTGQLTRIEAANELESLQKELESTTKTIEEATISIAKRFFAGV